jgi:hypothetical protein
MRNGVSGGADMQPVSGRRTGGLEEDAFHEKVGETLAQQGRSDAALGQSGLLGDLPDQYGGLGGESDLAPLRSG